MPDSDDLTVDVVAGGQRDEHGAEMVKLLSRRLSWSTTLAHWIDVETRRSLIAVLDAEMYPQG